MILPRLVIFTLITEFIILAVMLSSRPGLLARFGDFIENEMKPSPKAEWEIRLNHRDLWELESNIARAAKEGFLSKQARSWVRGEIIRSDEISSIQLRIRGDMPRHWNGPRRSYRLRLKDPSPWRGFQEVDLILPEDKSDEAEVVAYELARKIDLLAPVSGFTTLSINGVYQGTYLWRQSTGADFFELNHRPESVVFRENNFWWWGSRAGGPYDNLFDWGTVARKEFRLLPHLYAPLYQGPADATESFSRFARLYKELREEGPGLSEYLHEQRMIHWLALVMSFGSIHAVLADNLGWYLNTSTGLFEPLVYDVLPWKLPPEPFKLFRWKSSLISQFLRLRGSLVSEEFPKALDTIERNLPTILAEVRRQREEVELESSVGKRTAQLEELVRNNIRVLRRSLTKGMR